MIAGLAALAQETRLEIVRFLVRKGGDGAPAGDVGAHVKAASATLAFHLNILTGAGLLIRRRCGRNIIYRVDYGRLHAISAYLLEHCCAEAGESLGSSDAVPGEPTQLAGYRSRARSTSQPRRR
ncbi:MAG: ArsR family transcriptional regulator [Hyphomicrobiaceae bacterium]|nr:ArsR family transcriptional regulator [Hyphomicrobiaceae bacterium]